MESEDEDVVRWRHTPSTEVFLPPEEPSRPPVRERREEERPRRRGPAVGSLPSSQRPSFQLPLPPPQKKRPKIVPPPKAKKAFVTAEESWQPTQRSKVARKPRPGLSFRPSFLDEDSDDADDDSKAKAEPPVVVKVETKASSTKKKRRPQPKKQLSDLAGELLKVRRATTAAAARLRSGEQMSSLLDPRRTARLAVDCTVVDRLGDDPDASLVVLEVWVHRATPLVRDEPESFDQRRLFLALPARAVLVLHQANARALHADADASLRLYDPFLAPAADVTLESFLKTRSWKRENPSLVFLDAQLAETYPAHLAGPLPPVPPPPLPPSEPAERSGASRRQGAAEPTAHR
mmetsp:Transcript_16698/g.54365  ORF Transcript_16698/g.54365 Transcript_16698/m.54365 type:complete len:348 (+) Transcript_16698:98-1141(+)